MAASAYDTLVNTVKSLTAKAADLKQQILDRQNNAQINNYRAIIAKMGNDGKNVTDWISENGSGVQFSGGSAAQENKDARAAIAKVDFEITVLQGQLDDIIHPDTGELAKAQKAVTEYEKNSPVLSKQLDIALQSNQLVIAVVIFLILAITLTIVWLVKRHKKKKGETK